MYCPRCGAVNRDAASQCSGCSRELPSAVPPPPKVHNNLVSAIATTLCCCMPAGVVSLVYAVKSSSKLEVGDYVAAAEKYRLSRIWSWIALGLAAIGFALNILATVASEM